MSDTLYPFPRTLILEKCEYTGFERAYYADSDGKHSVQVGFAKDQMEF